MVVFFSETSPLALARAGPSPASGLSHVRFRLVRRKSKWTPHVRFRLVRLSHVRFRLVRASGLPIVKAYNEERTAVILNKMNVCQTQMAFQTWKLMCLRDPEIPNTSRGTIHAFLIQVFLIPHMNHWWLTFGNPCFCIVSDIRCRSPGRLHSSVVCRLL